MQRPGIVEAHENQQTNNTEKLGEGGVAEVWSQTTGGGQFLLFGLVP